MGLAVVHDRSQLEMTEEVPAELAPCGQQSHGPPGCVVPVRQAAVHLGRFEKVPIHGARIYH
ncbi:hypothetical protein GCM10017774_90540 [Lentzea cavernae]|uniref:Uncharacterized protein n=1 Tax=Lentzea cavernae TaxID=2020703 RepID=A0ABQ3MW94_9PSEU|nr:hypothetical protein GCM10017774_90540 [Lentzea cavernae]